MANRKTATDLRHKGAMAYQRAVAWLISEHQDAFDQRLGDEREAEGLSREKGPKKQPSRLEVLRKQIEELGGKPKV